jgi:hypothetical protein
MTATTTPTRATATAERVTKSTKSEKVRARTLRATASAKMETDAIAQFTTALREVLKELPLDPKGKPARKIKMKLAEGDARITISFEVTAKTRRK